MLKAFKYCKLKYIQETTTHLSIFGVISHHNTFGEYRLLGHAVRGTLPEIAVGRLNDEHVGLRLGYVLHGRRVGEGCFARRRFGRRLQEHCKRGKLLLEKL